MKNKNRRKYKDGDKVIVDGYEFTVLGYHYPSMSYVLKRKDGLEIFLKEDEFDTFHLCRLVHE